MAHMQLPQRESLELRGRLGNTPILCCAPFDLNERESYVSGYVAVTPESLFILEDGKLTREFPLSPGTQFKDVLRNTGGQLEYQSEIGQGVLVRYTMALLPRFAAMKQTLNSITVGASPVLKEPEDEKKCPKCGGPFIRRTHFCPNCTSRLSTFQRLGALIKENWSIYLVMILLFWASAAVLLWQPLVNRGLIDNALTPMAEGSMAPDLRLVLWYVFLIALCGLLSSATAMARQYVAVKAGSSMERKLKDMVYEKIHSLSLGYLETRRTGDLMNRISQDSNRIRRFMQDVAVQAFNELVLIVGVTVVLFVCQWQLALLATLPIPIVLFICFALRFRLNRMFHAQWVKMDKLNSLLNDVLNGIRVVKAFGQEDREIARFQKDAQTVRDITTKNECFFYTFMPITKFLIGLGSFWVLFYGGSLVLHMKLTPGELIQFSTYASYLYNKLDWFALLPRSLNEATTSAQRIFAILDEEPELPEQEHAPDLQVKGAVTLDHVTFGYQSYQPVLKDITLEIKPGEMVGLVGHSGAGKSTVINLVMRLYDADEGHILIDGADLSGISMASYKSSIGVVLQETFLFSGTILDNIRYAKPNATVEEVLRSAKIANAHDFIMKFPNGYDTLVGEKGQRLSGGERQRIAIARAVISDPKILILDEATSAVDTETEYLIQEALGRLIKGRTTIAIAHRLSTLKNADRLAVFSQGELKELGTHEELIQKKGIYYTLVTAQRKMTSLKSL